ncbi:MAG TPA: DEAD/DEAH box helicase, partial [Thermomicrobiales bacterium]|nr:DEAD/DEAH box helicase [Thermomicrobiales bacterium]
MRSPWTGCGGYTADMHEHDATDLPETQSRLYAEVALSRILPGSFRGVYTYEIPAGLQSAIERGVLVVAPIQKRLVPGVVLDLSFEEPDFTVRPVHSMPSPRLLVPADRLDLAEWLAHETASSVYAAVAPFLPPGLQTRMVETYSLSDNPDLSPDALTPSQRRVMGLLAQNGTMSIEQLRAATGKSLTSVMDKLQALELVRQEIRVDQSEPGRRTDRYVRLLDPDPDQVSRSPRQSRVLDELTTRRRFQRDNASDLVALVDLRTSVEADAQSLAAMEKKGIIEVVDLPRSEAPVPAPAPAPVLTPEQAAAWSTVERAILSGDSTPHLLFGVTGSGKTEIYLRGVAWCLRHGRGAIILVPEIGLATQVVRRFVDRFPGQVAVLHSQMTESQRHEVWRAVESGEYRVIVGPRSALFAPVERLGLIVL